MQARWTPLAAPVFALVVSLAALRFLETPPPAHAGARMELASAVWTLAAYALLALPWVERAAK